MTEEKMSLKNNTLKLVSVMAAFMIIGVGAYVFTSANPITQNSEPKNESSSVPKTEEMTNIATNEVLKNEEKIKSSIDDTSSVNDENIKTKTAGTYAPYSADQLSKASSGNVVLFFKASWCPTCVSTEKDINSNLDKIPSDLTILAVDYDKETELKKKYGITTQHSFVKVDKDGKELKKSPYGQTKTLENIIDFAN